MQMAALLKCRWHICHWKTKTKMHASRFRLHVRVSMKRTMLMQRRIWKTFPSTSPPMLDRWRGSSCILWLPWSDEEHPNARETSIAQRPTSKPILLHVWGKLTHDQCQGCLTLWLVATTEGSTTILPSLHVVIWTLSLAYGYMVDSALPHSIMLRSPSPSLTGSPRV